MWTATKGHVKYFTANRYHEDFGKLKLVNVR